MTSFDDLFFGVSSDIVEEEFLSIAEKLKPFTEEKMKIEPYPWFEDYLIDMDELYTELLLEKVERKLLGEETWTLRTYEDMFNCYKLDHKNRKILMKADPGMGKTTLGKKVAKDWATGVFKKFSIVFFVALKFVKPGDPIENVILQQNPELEGLGISKCKLKTLLNRFTSKILIIFDGLDEHGLGQNEDVVKIIKNQKLLDCGIVVSSRPHSVKEIERHFPTIIRVEGFTEKEASKFVSNFFVDETKITQILQFKPSDSREDFPVHRCPILLSFLCLLAKEDEIDLLDTNLTIGDLYLRMVQSLYKKFTIRKCVTFEKSEFVHVLKSVGQLALQTLKANNLLLQRSEVLRIVGDHAFEYGFFAGHQDFRLCTDPTADVYVTYAHRSIEEFFGSFGFLQALDEGKSVDDILGSDCEKPVFMMNPLFFTFCLWLLKTELFSARTNVYDKLVAYVVQRIDFNMLDAKCIGEVYPAMNIELAAKNKDSLKLEFFKNVLKQCKHVRILHLRFVRYLTSESYVQALEGFQVLISRSLLSKLTLLSINTSAFLPRVKNTCNNLTILIDHILGAIDDTHAILKSEQRTLTYFLRKCDPKRNPQVCTRKMCKDSHDLSTMIQTHTKQLRLVWFSASQKAPGKLFVSGEFPFCPHFTHFTAEDFIIDDSVPAAFMKAVKGGKFPNLRRIELNDCVLNDCEWPEVPEFSLEPVFDISEMQKLIVNLTELTVDISQISIIINCLSSADLEKLSVESWHDFIRRNIDLLNSFLEEFDPNHAEKLEKLALRWLIITPQQLEILCDRLSSIRLTELDMTCSSGFEGSLSVLFNHNLATLNTLILAGCKLTSEDLAALSRANVEGKLPQLRHLNILDNTMVKVSDLFTHSAKWNQLKTLAISDLDVLNVETNFLTSLEELSMSSHHEQRWPSVTRCWSGLKVIELVTMEDGACCVADGVERGMFPSLTTVRNVDAAEEDSSVLFRLCKANIFLQKK